MESWAESLAGSEVRGCVDDFTRSRASGWVVGPTEKMPVRVSLWLDDLEVTSVLAVERDNANTFGDARSFSIPIHDVWDYCRPDSRMTVRVEGRPLVMARKGIYKKPQRMGDGNQQELAERLANGWIINRWGQLQLSKRLDVAWQERVLSLARLISEVVESSSGYEPFVMYGSLLGQVREQNFIGHDDDFDLAYLSNCTEGQEAARELRDIGLSLVDAGFDVSFLPTTLHIKDAAGSERIDLFHVYFDNDDRLQLPFGRAGKTEMYRRQWQGLTSGLMGEHEVRIPVNAEDWAAHLYGETWRTPVAGFSWRNDRVVQDTTGHMPQQMRQEGYWSNFYARRDVSPPSTFCAFVLDHDNLPKTVLDLGCGDGRDSFGLAQAGRKVTGLDRSAVAIRHAKERADQSGLSDVLRFAELDVSDAAAIAEQVAEARSRTEDGRLMFYLRFFLHSLPEDVQDALLTALAKSSSPGDVFAAEFRTDADSDAKKVHGNHFRRYQNGPAFLKQLSQRYGFEVTYHREGRGMSPYGSEDPTLLRVLAVRTVSALPHQSVKPQAQPKSQAQQKQRSRSQKAASAQVPTIRRIRRGIARRLRAGARGLIRGK